MNPLSDLPGRVAAAIGCRKLELSLVAVALVGWRLEPSVGLALGITIALVLWLNLVGWLRIPEIVLAATVAGVALAWLGAIAPEGLLRSVAFALVFGAPVLLTRRTSGGHPPRGRLPLVLMMCGALFAAVLSATPTQLLRFLVLGFDNASHMALLEAFQRQHTFFFLDARFHASAPSFFRPVPEGTYATWHLLQLATGSIDAGGSATELVRNYTIFLLLTTAAFIASLLAIAIRLQPSLSELLAQGSGLRRDLHQRRAATPGDQSRAQKPLVVGAAAALLIGGISHLFWSGFPSLVHGLSLVGMSALTLDKAYRRRPERILFAIALLMALVYTYVLLVPLAACILLSGVVSEFGAPSPTERHSASPRLLLVIVAAGAALILSALPVISVTTRVASGPGAAVAFLVPGELEPLGWPSALLALAAALQIAWLAWSLRRPSLTLGILAASALAGLAAELSLVNTGSISYYPMRFIFGWWVVVLLLTIGIAAGTSSSALQLTAWGLLATALMAGQSGFEYPGAYMGSTIGVTRTALGWAPSDSRVCASQIWNASAAFAQSSADVVVVAESPTSPVVLPSRWAALLNYRWNDRSEAFLEYLDFHRESPNRLESAYADWQRRWGSGKVMVFGPASSIQTLASSPNVPQSVAFQVSECDTM